MTDDELFNLVQETETRMHGAGRVVWMHARHRRQAADVHEALQPARYTFADADAGLPKGTVLIVVDTYKGSRETTAETTARFARAHDILKRPEELSDEERRKLLEQYGKIFKKILGELKARAMRKAGQADGREPKAAGERFKQGHWRGLAIVRKAGALGAKLTGEAGKAVL